jgi:ubiquinone/menaquinone biosynthesis C-methylase UbiE
MEFSHLFFRVYTRFFGPPTSVSQNIRSRLLMKRLRDSSNGIFLDAGCGEGSLTINLAKKGKRIIGLDISENKIRNAKAKIPYGFEDKINFIVGDARYCPFKNNSFEKIVCIELLEHIKEDFQVITEFSGLLKKRGVLLLHTPHDNIITNFLDGKEIQKMAASEYGHVREGYSMDSIRDLFPPNGLNVIYYEYTFKTFGMIAWELSMKLPYYVYPLLFLISFFDRFSRRRGNGIFLIAKKT